MHHHCGMCLGVCLKARVGIIVFVSYYLFEEKKLFTLCFIIDKKNFLKCQDSWVLNSESSFF